MSITCWRTSWSLVVVGTLAVVPARSLRAQLNDTCEAPKGSNEAKLLAFFASPIAFSPGGFSQRLAPGGVRLEIEATYVPSPPNDIQQTQSCHFQKSENTDLSPVLPRPRIAVGLPGGFMVEASYLPPVTVADATPNMGSLALSWAHPIAGAPAKRQYSLLLRAHGTFGQVRGPITCPRESLEPATSTAACYGSEPSKDTYKPNMFGAETALMMDTGERFAAYAGAGVTQLMPRFEVGFHRTDGIFDQTRVVTDLTRGTLFAGASYRVLRASALTVELYSVPSDATTARIGASYQLR